MKVIIGGTEYQVTLPDRTMIATMRARVRLNDIEHNPYKMDGTAPDRDRLVKYMAIMDDDNYWLAEVCGVSQEDSVLQEAIGREIRQYIMQGPRVARPVTIEDLERMIGAVLLSDGSPTEKFKALHENAEKVRETIMTVTSATEKVIDDTPLPDPTPRPT